MKDVFDITIIGGGPSGLYSAFYAGLRGMKTKIIECQPVLGGKVHIYPEKFIWDIGGLPPITGQQFIENIVKQGLTFDPTVLLNTKVEKVAKEDDLFVITTDNGENHYSKTVVVAVGGGILNPMKLEVEGADKFEATNLYYTVQKIKHFQDKSLLISGGGNSAIDWACDLIGIAKDITIVYRGEELRAHEAHVQKVRDKGVQIYTKSIIQSLIASEDQTRIHKVVIENIETNEIITIAPDAVLVNHGYDRDQTFTFDAAIEPNRESERGYCLATNPRCETNIPGLFAAGDIAEYEGKIHLLAGVFQDAVNAVNSAKLYIEPDATKTAMVSSHNDKFDKRNREMIEEELKQGVLS